MGKILITGPGRAGTSFLVQVLTRLGCDTGFTPYAEPFSLDYRAGCEWYIPVCCEDTDNAIRERIARAPRVLKNCEWGLVLKWLISNGLLEVDYVLIPVRDLDDAARSRLSVGLDWLIEDGLLPEERQAQQAKINAMALGRAVEACLLYNLPCIILHYPLLVQSEEYLWRKLGELPFSFDRDEFSRVYDELNYNKERLCTT